LLTTPHHNSSTSDQARELRNLAALRRGDIYQFADKPAQTSRSVVIVSGKGGVGKSVIAFNLAATLARQNTAVGMLDISDGTGSLGLLGNQNGYWNLEHVLAGSRSLQEVILSGSNDTQIIPGSRHLLNTATIRTAAWRELIEFEQRQAWLISDLGFDVARARSIVAVVDHAVLVTTPEPTSVAEAYGTLKSLAAAGVARVSVLVNQADSNEQAAQIMDRLRHAARTFLSSDISLAGIIPFDSVVAQSVFRRLPWVEVDPRCPAQLAIEQVVQRLNRTVAGQSESFFERLNGRSASRAA
jgi:flagellar biosynthesis protein FlhG